VDLPARARGVEVLIGEVSFNEVADRVEARPQSPLPSPEFDPDSARVTRTGNIRVVLGLLACLVRNSVAKLSDAWPSERSSPGNRKGDRFTQRATPGRNAGAPQGDAVNDEPGDAVHAHLDRWLATGDEEARRELIDASYERLRQLAATILRESFPRLKRAPALVQTTDVANEAAQAMYRVLDEVRPATPRDYFALAAQRMRWLLLDRAKKLDLERRHLAAHGAPGEAQEPRSDESRQPALLSALYDLIAALPEREREVVDLIYFHGVTQATAAAVLDVTERTVRRTWTQARLHLSHGLEAIMPQGADALPGL
jgi:RNA polymerase sigma-70 factor (ECF subfamily)